MSGVSLPTFPPCARGDTGTILLDLSILNLISRARVGLLPPWRPAVHTAQCLVIIPAHSTTAVGAWDTHAWRRAVGVVTIRVAIPPDRWRSLLPLLAVLCCLDFLNTFHVFNRLHCGAVEVLRVCGSWEIRQGRGTIHRSVPRELASASHVNPLICLNMLKWF